MIIKQMSKKFHFILPLQDGSVLQTVTGLGSVVNNTWIPNMGVAACFGRSKVSLNTCKLNVYKNGIKIWDLICDKLKVSFRCWKMDFLNLPLERAWPTIFKIVVLL